MKLRFTRDALADIDAVLGGIADKSPSGANSVRRRLDALLTLLMDQPRLGVLTNSPTLRRIVLKPYPYLLFYQSTSEAVIVIGLRHAARDPSSMPSTDDASFSES